MNIKDIFDPNTYTTKAMPFSTQLSYMLDSTTDLGKMSNDSRKLAGEHSKEYIKFYSSLTTEQQETFEKIFENESRLISKEYFNRGFKFGVMLMKEALD